MSCVLWISPERLLQWLSYEEFLCYKTIKQTIFACSEYLDSAKDIGINIQPVFIFSLRREILWSEIQLTFKYDLLQKTGTFYLSLFLEEQPSQIDGHQPLGLQSWEEKSLCGFRDLRKNYQINSDQKMNQEY